MKLLSLGKQYSQRWLPLLLQGDRHFIMVHRLYRATARALLGLEAGFSSAQCLSAICSLQSGLLGSDLQTWLRVLLYLDLLIAGVP